MNRRTVVLVLAAAAVVAAVAVGVYGPLDPFDVDGTADAAETPRFVHDGEQLTLEPASGQTIRGETDLEGGTELSVRVRSSGENPFLRSRPTTVDEDGTFEVTFDMSDVPEGTTFEVTAHRNGTRLAATTGEVVS